MGCVFKFAVRGEYYHTNVRGECYHIAARGNIMTLLSGVGAITTGQLDEAKIPTVVSGVKAYAAATSTRRESKSVECQTSLTCFFLSRTST